MTRRRRSAASARPTRSAGSGPPGDLGYKMTIPALYAMARHGHLDVPVIGVAYATL